MNFQTDSSFGGAPGFLPGACSPLLATCSLNHTPLMSSYTTNHDNDRRPIDALGRYLLPSRMPSYSLTSRMEKQITSLIKSERFANRSEVIRAGLRLLEDYEITKAAREVQRLNPRSPQRKTPSAVPTPRQYPLPAPSRAPKRSRLAAGNKPAQSPRSSRSR